MLHFHTHAVEEIKLIVKLMLRIGGDKITELKNGLVCACRNNHIKIVRLLIRKGANDWDNGLDAACGGGNLEIAKLMIQKRSC